ncbi:MAG: AIR synthase-related protein [Cytophagaceae bacterium]|nr:AIR synthase-related protein [Cytophagaceae bacterium]
MNYNAEGYHPDLSTEELQLATALVGRALHPLEVFLIGACWEDAFSKKNSSTWLQKLPRLVQDDFTKLNYLPVTKGLLVVQHRSEHTLSFPMGKAIAAHVSHSLTLPGCRAPLNAHGIEISVYWLDNDEALYPPSIGDKLIAIKSPTRNFTKALTALESLDCVTGLVLAENHRLAAALMRIGLRSEGLELRLDHFKNADPVLALKNTEPMLLVTTKAHRTEALIRLLEQEGYDSQLLGSSTGDRHLSLIKQNKVLAYLPLNDIHTASPAYHHAYTEPPHIRTWAKLQYESLELPHNYPEIARFLLQHPEINGHKELLSEDRFGSEALILEHQGQSFAFGLSSNARYLHAQPEQGAAMLAAQAVRQVIVAGGEAAAITFQCFSEDPKQSENYWMFVYAMLGIKKAAETLNTPVLQEYVSFQSGQGLGLHVCALGIINPALQRSLEFKNPGDLIYLVGYSKEDYGSSYYLHEWLGLKESAAPYFNLNEEYNVQELIKGLIREDLLESAHSVREGGLFNALAECGICSGLGFKIHSDFRYRKDAWLFGEKQSRVLVTVKSEKEADFLKFVRNARNLLSREGNLGVEVIGTVTTADFVVDNVVYMNVEEARSLYAKAQSAF